jgi:hypothetical protein
MTNNGAIDIKESNLNRKRRASETDIVSDVETITVRKSSQLNCFHPQTIIPFSTW